MACSSCCNSGLNCNSENSPPDVLSGTEINSPVITGGTITGTATSGGTSSGETITNPTISGGTIAESTVIAGLNASVATIALLKAKSVTGLVTGREQEVLGYYAAGDGGGGQFVYNSASVAADNGGTVIAPSVGSGRWLRNYEGPLNVLWFGAKGDGSTDDFTAVQAAVSAAVNGAVRFQPQKTFAVETEVVVASASGRCAIIGYGATIKATGATNKCIHVTGTAGVTTNEVHVHGLTFSSATSGNSAAGLHLDGIAHWTVKDCSFLNGTKMTYGIRCTGAQQGEIAGCEFVTDYGILAEDSGGVSSNGIDIHGNTFVGVTRGIKATGVDSVFIHDNHLTSAAVQIEAGGSSSGMVSITNNQIESVGAGNAGVDLDVRTFMSGNVILGLAGTVDLRVRLNAHETKIVGNLITANVQFDATVTDVMFAFNSTGGTITDNGTRTRNLCNRAYAGTPLVGSALFDALTLTAQGAAGNILHLKPSSTGGHWGLKIEGAGAGNDIYVDLGNLALCGNTSGGVGRIKSAPGGTSWIEVDATKLETLAGSLVTGAAAPLAVGAGKVSVSGATQATIGANGAASALTANPLGYIKINVAGVAAIVPYYNA